MKLYHIPVTPSSRKVRVFLHEKRLSVPLEDVGAERFQLTEWYKRMYPHALVPMLLLDDGTQLGESVAICRYFETLHPEPALMGTDAKSRAVVEMWERRAYGEGMGAMDDIFRNSHPLMADRGVAGSPEPVPQVPALVERGRDRLRRFYDKFDQQLRDKEFIAGTAFSVADISALCAIDFARWCQLMIPEHCVHLHRWYEAVSARPSAKV